MLKICHVELREANDFVARFHRHHKPVVGHRFSIGVKEENKLVGVAIIGRPVARMTDQHSVVEVTRLCTDGTKNACSILYAAAARAAKELGYERIQTFILKSEPGTSLKAAGWNLDHVTDGGKWSRPSRKREDDHPVEQKVCWSKSFL